MTTTQQDPALLRLTAGRAEAADKQPYLRTALFAIKHVREPRIPTLGVDPQWRMYWNPDFIMTLSVEECAGAWLHEVGHLLRDHRQRFDALLEPQNRHPLWNKAGDAAINQDLRDAGINLPAIKAIYPEYIPGAEPGMTTEQMYRLILDTPEAEQIAQQAEDMRLLPNAVVTGKAEGQRIIGMTRSAFLDNQDLTVAVVNAASGDEVAVREQQAHDKRTLSFVLDAEIEEAGTYTVSVTSGDKDVQATLHVVAPSITFRPDHITRGWSAPYKVTVVGTHTDFTQNAVVTMTNDDATINVEVADTEHVSKSYLSFHINEQVPDGVYKVTVTDGAETITSTLPVGLPFMDIVPNTLPVGHGTPYPFAAVVDDFTFDTATTLELFQNTPFGPMPVENALTGLTIKTPTTADFTLDVSLVEGEYLVIASTGPEQAVATLTVSTGSGEGEGSGEGKSEGQDSGEGQGKSEGQDSGEGEGQGSGEGEGQGQGQFDDCGSGIGGGERPWDKGGDTSDGSVDAGRGNLIREQVARDVAEHQKTRGNVPGGWTRWADSILKPQVDWRKELRSVVRRTCATVAGMRDYTYQRPSRRSGAVPNVVLPALRSPRPPQAAIVVDTSGSVSDRMLGQAIGDMQALLKQITAAGGDNLKIIACDAAAADMKTVRDMKNLTALEGGGGTDMRVGIQAAAEIKPKMDLIITFTDGETPWPDAPPVANPRAKYIAVLLAGDTSGHYEVPDFMHKIVVNDDYLREARPR